MTHRDIKPQNVLLMSLEAEDLSVKNVCAKLADFGLSRVHGAGNQPMTLACGTPAYMAPEQIIGDGHYDEKVDMYAVGVMINALLSQEEPYQNQGPKNITDQLLRVANDQLRPAIGASVPKALQRLIRRCWAQDPAERPDVHLLVNELEQFVTKSQRTPNFKRNKT